MQKNEQQLLFHTHFLTLPNKIQNEVDNALSQLEAAPSNIRVYLLLKNNYFIVTFIS